MSVSLFHSAANAIRWFQQPYQFLDKKMAEEGLTFEIDLPKMKRVLVTGDPLYISAIRKNRDLIGGRGTQFLQVIIGNSTIALEGQEHLDARKVFNPLFHALDLEHAQKLTVLAMEKNSAIFKKGSVFALEEWAERVVLDTIIRVTFGDIPEERFQKLFSAIFSWKRSFKNPLPLFLKPLQVSLSKEFGWGKFLQQRAALHALIQEEIRQPSFQTLPGILTTVRSTTDWSQERLLSEMMSVLMFGHDTTALMTAWWGYHMLANQHWQPNYSPATIESSMKESMRLTPPVVHLTRVARVATTLLDRPLEQNRKVLPCMYLAHHNPAVFPSPYSFQLDRFVDPSASDLNHFFPFGFGDRLCLGKNLAEFQLSVIGAWLLQNTKLSLAHDRTHAVRKFVLMAPSEGTMVRVL